LVEDAALKLYPNGEWPVTSFNDNALIFADDDNMACDVKGDFCESIIG